MLIIKKSIHFGRSAILPISELRSLSSYCPRGCAIICGAADGPPNPAPNPAHNFCLFCLFYYFACYFVYFVYYFVYFVYFIILLFCYFVIFVILLFYDGPPNLIHHPILHYDYLP